MNFRKRMTAPDVGFQMAPMVDILFLLLVFYMASTIFAQYETKLEITVPTADRGVRGIREAAEIVINIAATGENGAESAIYINDIEVSIARLQDLLGQIAQDYRDQPVIIRADSETRHKYVVAVLDVCKKVDIWNVAFATIPPRAQE